MLRGWQRRRSTEIGGIWTPLAFRNFDGDQASQTLLMPGSAEGGKFAAHGDCWRRDGILRYACPGAAQRGLHRLDIVVMPTTVVMCGWILLGFAIVCGRSRPGAIALGPDVLRARPAPISLNPLPLTFSRIFVWSRRRRVFAIALGIRMIGFSAPWALLVGP